MFLKGREETAGERVRRRQATQKKEERLLREHEMREMTIQAGENDRLMEKEREQLTALIGNVAHDLKTPLQSFRMELDSLKKRITFDYRALELIKKRSDHIDDDHPLNIITSVNAAVEFMTMAINRSIDFAKVSGDIDLVPSLDTFNIPDALSVSVNVIRHIQNDLTITVNPISPEICLNVISDKVRKTLLTHIYIFIHFNLLST